MVVAAPYLWLLLFFLVPFLIVLKIALAESVLARPPFTPLVSIIDQATIQVSVTFGNFLFVLDDPLYVVAYLNSLKIAFVSTVLALLIGYPMAYAMVLAPERYRVILLMLVILPFWTSFVIRIYAWIGILSNTGYLNTLLLSVGVIDQPIQMLQTDFAVYLGVVYTYLPFMILPLYAQLERQDHSLLEAAMDLGATPIKAFLTITLPLSLPGIVAGSMLVFIPVIGEFVIPELLGGPDTLMIGGVLWDEFFHNRDWPVASAVAVILLLVLVVPIMAFQALQARERG